MQMFRTLTRSCAKTACPEPLRHAEHAEIHHITNVTSLNSVSTLSSDVTSTLTVVWARTRMTVRMSTGRRI